MDFNDTIALYDCLSMQLTSDSEMSNDELSFPRGNEVLDIDIYNVDTSVKCNTFNTNNKCNTSDNHKADTISHCSVSDVDVRKSKENMKNKQFRNGENEKKSNVIKGDCNSEGNDIPYEQLSNQKSEKDYLLKDEEEANYFYEASEESSSDETVVDLYKPKREKTSSGASSTAYVCPYEGCGKKFNKPSRLSVHEIVHTGKRPFKCNEEGCGRTYIRKQHLQRHTTTAHRKTKPQEYLKCEECNKLMKNKYSMAKHYQRAHILKNYSCKECGKSFRKQKLLKSHSFEHTGIEPYMCEYPGCGKRFMVTSKLRIHALAHIQKCYKCPNELCGETFDIHHDLRKHLATNHPKVCDVCGKKYRRLAQLRMHRKTHDDVREAFYCPFSKCDRYYYAMKNLVKHIRDKHEGTSIYQCSICSLRLSNKQKLAYHMTTHSPSYKRNYHSSKPRQPRKDKGVSRTDYARLLSGYTEDDLDDHPSAAINNSQTNTEDEERESLSNDGCGIADSRDMGKEAKGKSEIEYSIVSAESPAISKLHSVKSLNSPVSNHLFSKLVITSSEDEMERLVLSSDDVQDSDFL